MTAKKRRFERAVRALNEGLDELSRVYRRTDIGTRQKARIIKEEGAALARRVRKIDPSLDTDADA